MKFLVVEDDLAARNLLVLYLEPYGDCDTAADGEDALLAIHASMQKNEPYDAVFLDIIMPKMNGRQTLKKIRGMEASSGTKSTIIMTTAVDDEDKIVDAFIDECDAYIVKPIEKDKLVLTLEQFNLV